MLLQAVGDRPLIKVSEHRFLDEKKLVVGVGLDTTNVGPEHLLFDLLDFETDFLTIW